MRSTLDPLTLTPLRNAVIHSAWGRGKIDLPPGIAKKLRDTPIFVGADIRESKFRKHLAKSMRVERISDNDRNRKFKVKDERHESQQADRGRNQQDQGRNQQDHGRNQADHGRNQADHRSNQQDRGAQRNQEKAQQPQGERVGNPAKHEAKQQSQGASKKDRKHESPSQSGRQGREGDGKGKGKGKP